MAPKIAVAVPCYNEEMTIAKVVKDFKKVLPDAAVYVFDNHSTDRSAALAREAGATVVPVYRRGKGNVMRAIFDKIAADALVIVDGDDTYPAQEAPKLLAPVLSGEADMVVGNRLKQADEKAMDQLHAVGNHLIVKVINVIFGTSYEDILSGYRVLGRRLTRTVPLLTHGFETETELTLQVLEEGLIVKEIPISFQARPVESPSKLRPFMDGTRIMVTIAMLLRDHHPLRVYGVLSLICLMAALVAGVAFYGFHVGEQQMANGIVLLFLPLSVIYMGVGFILSAVNTRLREIRQIFNRKSETYEQK